jgi:hypothetical protein
MDKARMAMTIISFSCRLPGLSTKALPITILWLNESKTLKKYLKKKHLHSTTTNWVPIISGRPFVRLSLQM